MRKYEYNGKIEELKTLPSEITIEEFQKIINNQNKYSGNFMYYLEAFEILGLSTEFVDVIDDKTLWIILKDFQDDFVMPSNEFRKEFEIDGYTYRAYEDEFKIGARDFAKIEEQMHKYPNDWITYALAIIFKRVDLSTVEHTTEAHINHKVKLFKKLTMDIALPYIFYLSENYINNIKLIAGI